MNKYRISLWPGAGYWLQETVVEASCPEEALVLASKEIGFCIPVDEADEDVENSDLYTYLDRTEYGMSNVYLLTENTMIEEM